MAYLGGTTATGDNGATSISAAFPASVTSGSLLVAVVSWDGGGTLSGVTDTAGNTWQLIGTSTLSTTDQQRVQMAYAMNANAGATTVSANFASNIGWRRLAIGEWSGVATSAALDVQGGQQGSNTTATDNVTSGNVTPTANGELIVGGAANTNLATVTITAGTGFTKRASGDVIALEDQVQATAAAIAARWTYGTAGRYVAKVATFRAAAGGSQSVSGTVPAVTTTSGTVQARLAANATAPVVVAATGTPTSRQGAAGTAAAISTASGAPTSLSPASGVASAVSGVAGSITTALSASGSVPLVSHASGTATAASPVAGTTPITTGLSGAPTRLGQRHAVAATVAVAASVIGDTGQRHSVTAVVAVVSDASGTVGQTIPAFGVVTIISTVIGTVTLGSELRDITFTGHPVERQITGRIHQREAGTVRGRTITGSVRG